MFAGGKHFKLDGGIEQLETWAANARQVQKNHLYKALFAVTDGSVFSTHGVLQDTENPHAKFILVREDLVLKVSYSHDSFGILYIGPLEGAPGLNLALDAT
jgi:Family of unknown function (DUF6235)